MRGKFSFSPCDATVCISRKRTIVRSRPKRDKEIDNSHIFSLSLVLELPPRRASLSDCGDSLKTRVAQRSCHVATTVV